ncbi:hypothetical protein T265_07413 [Opisthorchis viverrini]|uniref:C2H2-type domain-containing protein n=1 Tax=Opisthorchis viverrini TaxID=6198 RepID=A0A074ZP25_OPIVI|nr:hypothetical protein T265_07413 [Opisthorchis viverrini]KER25080.1 hypothetical protein T265_07413 [Opisthorchis viverrini]
MYVNHLRSFVRNLRAQPTRLHTRASQISPVLQYCDFVFVRVDQVKKPLQPPYVGPYRVISCRPKYFVIDKGGVQDTVSVDRLKVAHVDPTLFSPINQSQRLSTPPLHTNDIAIPKPDNLQPADHTRSDSKALLVATVKMGDSAVEKRVMLDIILSFIWIASDKLRTAEHRTPSAHRTDDDCPRADPPDYRSKETHPAVPQNCLVCGKSFRHLSSAKRHQELHAENASAQCSLCKSSFRNERYLRQHMRRLHSPGEKKPRRTSSKRVPESELRDNPCPKCGKCFLTWKTLSQHLKWSHDEEAHQQCEECGAFFQRKSNLDRHLSTVHEKQRHYMCDQCGQTFARLDILRRHVAQMHTNHPDDKRLINEKPMDY